MACNQNAETVSDATIAFTSNPNEANCLAFKNALKDFLKSCPNFYTGAQKAQLEEAVNSPCDL